MKLKVGLMFGTCLLIAGCGMQPMKPSPGHVQAAAPAPAGEIPEPVRITPILPKPKPAAQPETYSVVVNNVKVQELLFALARDAKLNVDIHSGIAGSVTLNAIDQTLQQLLARIAKQVDMRYELDGPNLAVMPDTPYLRIYKVDYVNMQRDTDSKVGTSTQVATPGAGGAGGGGGGAGGNQSTTSITSKATNHFWDTLVKNVQDILHETDKILPAPGQAGVAVPAAVPVATPAAPRGAAAGAAPAAAATPAQQAASFREAASVIANPESGVLSIRATSRQHEKIQEFLDQVLSNAKRQVLIEATIAEVQLNNQYQQGIDWSAARQGSTGFTFSQSASGSTTASPTGSLFVLGAAAPNYSNLLASVRLLESFGNVRVLSSPRLTVLNNQTAILKVVDNRVYFTIQGTTVPGTINSATVTTFTTTPNIVAVGLIMNVTPQISEADSVLLNVRPSVSRIVDYVNDPNPSLGAIVSRIPVIRTREMESMIKVNSGQIAVMGGLIQDEVNDLEDSVPGASRLAGYGGFFGNKNQSNTKTELVVFMRPIIIRDASIDGDYRGYRTFLPDDKFMAAPNPGKPPLLGDPQGAPR
ncbi:MAG: type II and III secretion system protein [Betaproteobacteria bacterium RIFCSPLOWO2_12_FULL_64_23]|nr:MAG: type II and III secretion system protein [Betaproteobacteria bacterium RIFCSPLOWO2_12_FULL_64_23]